MCKVSVGLQNGRGGAGTQKGRLFLCTAITQKEPSLLCKVDKQHQYGSGCCGIDKAEELTEYTVVNMVWCDGEVAGVMHVVRTLHAVCSGVCHGLVTVESREQYHRYEYR